MREPMRSLRDRLRDELPRDPAAREQLAVLYRAIGHPEQAGRWAVGSDGVATTWEITSYASLLVAERSDSESGLRRLSRIPAHEPLGDDARAVLTAASPQGAATTPETGWRSFVRRIAGPIAGALTGFAGLILLFFPLLVTIWAFSGESGVRTLARTGALVVLFLVTAATAFAVPYFAVRRRYTLALVCVLVALLLGAVFALWAPAPSLHAPWES